MIGCKFGMRKISIEFMSSLPMLHTMPHKPRYFFCCLHVLCWTLLLCWNDVCISLHILAGKRCSSAVWCEKCRLQCSWGFLQVGINRYWDTIYAFWWYHTYNFNILSDLIKKGIWWKSTEESIWTIVRKWVTGSSLCSRCRWLLSLRGNLLDTFMSYMYSIYVVWSFMLVC